MRKAKNANFKVQGSFVGYIPSWGGIVGLLLWLLAGGLLGNLVTFLLSKWMTLDTELVLLISYPLQFLPAVVYASVRSAHTVAYPEAKTLALDRNNFEPKAPWACALLAAVAVLAGAFVCDPLVKVLPQMPENLKALLESMTEGRLWANLLCVAVFAPVCEEWLCRGMVLRGLLSRGVRPWVAIVVSALFFALIHMNPWQAIPAFLMGALMGYVYYKTGSLKMTMLMHAVNNGSAVLLTKIPALQEAESWMDVMSPVWFLVIFCVCILVLYIVIRWISVIKTPDWEAR